jgi:hypothetical protein
MGNYNLAMSVRSTSLGLALCVITVMTLGPIEVFACPYTDCTVCDENGDNCRPLVEDPFESDSLEADSATSLGTAAEGVLQLVVFFTSMWAGLMMFIGY